MAEALALIPKRAHRAAVVVSDGKPVGVVSEADCIEVDRFAQVGQVMNPSFVQIAADTAPRDAFDALDAPVSRLGALDTPVPFSKALEEVFSPRARLLPALRALLAY